MNELIAALRMGVKAISAFGEAISRQITPILDRLAESIEETEADISERVKRFTAFIPNEWIDNATIAPLEMESSDMSNSSPFIVRKGFNPDTIAPDLHKEFSSKGGRAAAERGTLHKFSPGEAAKGGSAGGRARAAMPGAMSEMGRKGGAASGLARRRRRAEREAAERKKQGGDDESAL